MGRTLYDKLWDSHVIRAYDDGSALLYVDRHLLHEVSTPQSFIAIEQKNRSVRRPLANLAVPDHVVPTTNRRLPAPDLLARAQTQRLVENVARHSIPFIPLDDRRQGIVHVIGPEQGFTLPGIVLACGDSHTSTHGAFGCLAFGIGASECGIVMATQSLRQQRARTMRVTVVGARSPFITAKDIALAFIARIGANGAAGHAVEYAGPVISAMSMAERLTLCNMSIEAGARVGLIAPDEETFAYLRGRPMAPKGEMFERAVDDWRTLPSDPDSVFDRELTLDVTHVEPHVTWGTSPEDAAPIGARVPSLEEVAEPTRRERRKRALAYMGLHPGQALEDIAIDVAFIGSCTNSRIEDLRAAAGVAAGRRVAATVKAIVVPGSGLVREQAEREGLAKIFLDAGFEWREPGCSMCVGMNGDTLAPAQRCASTANRNFEGRQGVGGRTHLMSPAMAAAAAITGRLTDVRKLMGGGV